MTPAPAAVAVSAPVGPNRHGFCWGKFGQDNGPTRTSRQSGASGQAFCEERLWFIKIRV
jgi:hypothetical protein